MSKNQILFFIRAYNDIDHMTPVIYKIVKDNPRLNILIINFSLVNKFLGDFRIKFLRAKGVKIIHFLDIIKVPKSLQSLFFKANVFDSKTHKLNPFRLLINRFFIQPFRYFTVKKMEKLSREKPQSVINPDCKVVVIDHKWATYTFPGTAYYSLAKFCKTKQKITISIPHGHITFSNSLIRNSMLDTDPTKIVSHSLSDKAYTDYVVFENNIMSDRYIKSKIVAKSQSVVLGSSRFSNEWTKKLRLLMPVKDMLVKNSKVTKIVWFLSPEKYNVNLSETKRIIKYISKFPNLSVIIKPHTRRNTMLDFNIKNPNVIFADESLHSPQLIDWADLVMFTTTSVIFDALRRDKKIFYMKCLHSNTLLSEDYFKSWEIHSRDQFRDELWKIIKDKSYRTYSKSDSKNYLLNTIQPNGEDVLRLYSDFILKFC